MPEQDESIPDLVQDIQKEARKLRNELGQSHIPPLDPAESAGRAVGSRGDSTPEAGSGSLYTSTISELRRSLNPAAARIESHRGRIGRLIVLAKKLVAKLMTPSLEQQAAFNQATLDGLEQLDSIIAHQRTTRLDALEKRLTQIEGQATPPPPSASDFDYLGFEKAFRGDSQHVASIQEKYLTYFPDAAAGPVVDLGCGRGEFLSLLNERGVPCWGVERERECAEAARKSGLEIREEDLAVALLDCDEGSLGGIVSFQVFEHLQLGKISQVLELAKRKIRSGGVLIVETVNVASLITHSRAFTLDPTHQLALHPLTLRLLVEQNGFKQAEIIYSGEVEDHVRLETTGLEPALAKNLERLNDLLFAPQDYAIVARA